MMLYQISAGSCILVEEDLEAVSHGSDDGSAKLRRLIRPDVLR